MRLPSATALGLSLLLLSMPAVRAQPAPAGPPSMAPAGLVEQVERAWRLSRREDAGRARAEELAAREAATRAPFAGAPAVGLDVRRDLPRDVGLPGTDRSSERGKNEIEPAFAAPLWLPGQREAQRRVIGREREALDAQGRLARWRLAGEVRDAVWRLDGARVEAGLQQARLEAAVALEADVARRVTAGDLARTDLWLSQAETRAARAAQMEAAGRVAEAQATLAALTGLDDAPDVLETPRAEPTEAHPLLKALDEDLAAARSRLDYTRATRRDNPTFSVVGRFDRDARDTPYRNTVRMGVTVPLDTEARNAPRIAGAAAEAVDRELVLAREQRQLAAEQRRARAALEAARAALAEHTERARLSRDTVDAVERAFRAGERGLPELLRLRAALLDAQLARDLARSTLGAAVARLNQSLGDLP